MRSAAERQAESVRVMESSRGRSGRPPLLPMTTMEGLREDDVLNVPNTPPIAGPEIDTDLDMEPADSGIDDGLLPPKPPGSPRRRGSSPGGRRPSVPFPTFPVHPEDGPHFNPSDPRGGVDINVYQHKKTLAQGMMDLALLSANANQLRYVLETGSSNPYYYPSLVMISLSLILQIAVGIGLIINSRYNIKKEGQVYKADKINNFTVIGIFLVTIINVFISAFGVGNTQNVEPIRLTDEAEIENATVEQEPHL